MTVVTHRPKNGLFWVYGSTQINVHHYGREALHRAVMEVGIAARSSLQPQTGSRGNKLEMAGSL